MRMPFGLWLNVFVWHNFGLWLYVLYVCDIPAAMQALVYLCLCICICVFVFVFIYSFV